MSESARADFAATAPARAAELIADFMTRQEAWRKQAHDLARHRDEVRTAAEHEAADLLAKARADIKRTLVETRRELMMLATQLRVVCEPLQTATPQNEFIGSTPAPTTDWKAVPESVAAIRRNLQNVLAEARPDLDELATLTHFFRNGAYARESDKDSSDSRPDTSESSRNPFPYKALETTPALTDRSPSENSAATQRPAVTYGEQVRGLGHGKAVALVLAALAATVVPIAAWRLALFTGGSARRSAPVTVTAGVKSKPAATTAPATQQLTPVPASSPRVERSAVPASVSSDRQTWLWLVVEARRSAWIQVTTDGRTETGRVLQVGESRRILATHSISIVVGDGGAVTLSLNGGKATPPGRDGQVVTRQFNADDATKTAVSEMRTGTAGR